MKDSTIKIKIRITKNHLWLSVFFIMLISGGMFSLAEYPPNPGHPLTDIVGITQPGTDKLAYVNRSLYTDEVSWYGMELSYWGNTLAFDIAPAGTVCGLGSNKDGTKATQIKCKGYAPHESCPDGYARVKTVALNEGTPGRALFFCVKCSTKVADCDPLALY